MLSCLTQSCDTQKVKLMAARENKTPLLYNNRAKQHANSMQGEKEIASTNHKEISQQKWGGIYGLVHWQFSKSNRSIKLRCLLGQPGTQGRGLQTFKQKLLFFASFEVSSATQGLLSLLKSLRSYSLPAESKIRETKKLD